jgi:hypothetical protein
MNETCPPFTPSAVQCVTDGSVFGCMPYTMHYSQPYDDSVAILSIPLSLVGIMQIYSLWRTQSDQPESESYKAVSMSNWLLTVIINVIWVVDGMMHRSYTIFITSLIQALVALCIVLLLLKYNRFYCAEHIYTRCALR